MHALVNTLENRGSLINDGSALMLMMATPKVETLERDRWKMDGEESNDKVSAVR